MSANNTEHLTPPDDSPKFAADGFLAVVNSSNRKEVEFIGTREECYSFLRELDNKELAKVDLRYISDGQLHRMSSFVL